MTKSQPKRPSNGRRLSTPTTTAEIICPACGGETVHIHGRMVCTTCRTIVQTCCE
ncbi:MAG: hypothetical protein IT371_04580 [Deltaproteobacteria bacterium]|nr:hypothetical protein [Deltaproteobacteria bacterium]